MKEYDGSSIVERHHNRLPHLRGRRRNNSPRNEVFSHGQETPFAAYVECKPRTSLETQSAERQSVERKLIEGASLQASLERLPQ